MMISTKLSLQSLTLVLVVFTIFSVSLTENLQLADGFSASGAKIIFDVEQGETAVHEWMLRNAIDEAIGIEVYTVGPGSELLTYEKLHILEPGEMINPEIFVTIPDDHADNISYKVELYALKRAPDLEEGVTGIKVNSQLKSFIWINIGDNPIYTPPPVPIKSEVPPEPVIITAPKVEEGEEPVPIIEETLQEKLARINAANEQIATEATVDDTFEEEAVPELQVDDNYIPEPVMDTEPVAQEEGGGCLIATATFGSELAPQVQLLREIRDNQLMGTGSGMAFMSGFNQLYYSFSPYIADMERDNPAFKELVKLTITPMISTLSVMEHAESDSEVLGLGIGVILMNLGMYVGLPTFGIVKLIQFRKN